MKQLPDLVSAVLVTGKRRTLLINPILRTEEGIIYLDCVLPPEFRDGKLLGDVLGFRAGAREILVEELPDVEATGSFGTIVILRKVLTDSIQLNTLKASFKVCRNVHEIFKIQGKKLTGRKNNVLSISIEGLKVLHENETVTEKYRVEYGKKEKISWQPVNDNTELNLWFENKGKVYDLKTILWHEEVSNLEYLKFTDVGDSLDLETYNEIKEPLRAFLSFVGSNTLRIRSEYLQTENGNENIVYPFQKIERENYSPYFPISNAKFRRERFFQKYLDCFSTFLILDKKLDLSYLIYLLNETNKLGYETACFVYIVAIERLADKLYKSDLIPNTQKTLIPSKEFDNRIEEVRKIFEKEFADLTKKKDYKKAVSDLKSRLGNINQYRKTESKIDLLLEYAEIKVTSEIKHLFPLLRNKVIHEGEVDFPDGAGVENYKALNKLIRNIVANLIQYDGYRIVGREGNKILAEQKKSYKNPIPKKDVLQSQELRYQQKDKD